MKHTHTQTVHISSRDHSREREREREREDTPATPNLSSLLRLSFHYRIYLLYSPRRVHAHTHTREHVSFLYVAPTFAIFSSRLYRRATAPLLFRPFTESFLHSRVFVRGTPLCPLDFPLLFFLGELKFAFLRERERERERARPFGLFLSCFIYHDRRRRRLLWLVWPRLRSSYFSGSLSLSLSLSFAFFRRFSIIRFCARF